MSQVIFPAQREERGEETSQKRKQGKGLLCRRVPWPSDVGNREKLDEISALDGETLW
jgi:hypothetical protein